MGIGLRTSGGYLRRTSNIPSGNPSPFTALGWTQLYARNAGTYQYIFSLDDAGSNYIQCGYNDGDEWEITHPNIAGGLVFSTEPTLSKWFFWAVTDEHTTGGEVNGYWGHFDSVTLDSVNSAAGSTGFTATGMFVGSSGFGEWINADHFGVRIYDRVLTEAEIYNERWVIAPRDTTSINIYSPLWDANDTRDYSPNGYDWDGNNVTDASNPPISYGV